MKNTLQVRDLVEATGLDRETLRYYEQVGLLPKPRRSDAGYRQYEPEVVDRIKFIRLAQQVGFSLKEIAELLSLGQRKPVTKFELKKIGEEKIKSLDQKIESFKTMRQLLVNLTERASKLSKESSCPILSQIKNLELL